MNREIISQLSSMRHNIGSVWMGKRIKRKSLKKKRSLEAVSEVLETIILLGMTVSFFSILYLFVFSFSFAPVIPTVQVLATTSGDNIILYHQGGDPLPTGTAILLTIDDVPYTRTIGDYLDDTSKINSQWNMGERLVIDDVKLYEKQGNNLIKLPGQIKIIDKANNIMIFYGNI